MESEARVKAEECYIDAQAIMNRIKEGETGRRLRRDILDLAASFNVLADLVEEE